jgi:hypothetical protein
MAKILSTVTHDVVNNTLEVTYLKEIFSDEDPLVVEEYRRITTNYSIEQKQAFIDKLGNKATKYINMANW